MKHAVVKLLGVLLLGIMPYLGYAEVPGTINFQGYLSDDSGKPLNESADMTFTIPGTGWVEVHTNVPVKKGVFSVQLGSQTSLDEVNFGEGHEWIQVEMNGNSRTVTLSSVPYALHAKIAEHARTIDTIFCSQHGSCRGQSGWTTKTFSADNCGGILPDETYIGVLKKLYSCYGPASHNVLNANELGGPGVYWYQDNTCCTSYQIEALYIKHFIK